MPALRIPREPRALRAPRGFTLQPPMPGRLEEIATLRAATIVGER